MTSSEDRQQWLDALHAHHSDQDRLFSLVAGLANLLDRRQVVETIGSVLGITPVEDGDSVMFDDLTIRFGADGRVKSVFRTIDGSRTI